jgi:hypothetical protein
MMRDPAQAPKSQRSAQSPLGKDGPTDRTSRSWRPRWKYGGGAGKDRGGDLVVRERLSQIRSTPPGWPLVVRERLSQIREVLDAAGLAALVDEVETTELEMTHD